MKNKNENKYPSGKNRPRLKPDWQTVNCFVFSLSHTGSSCSCWGSCSSHVHFSIFLSHTECCNANYINRDYITYTILCVTCCMYMFGIILYECVGVLFSIVLHHFEAKWWFVIARVFGQCNRDSPKVSTLNILVKLSKSNQRSSKCD